MLNFKTHIKPVSAKRRASSGFSHNHNNNIANDSNIISSDIDIDDNDSDNGSIGSLASIHHLKNFISRDNFISTFIYSLNYENAKNYFKYLIDDMNVVDIHFKFENIMLIVTVYVLFYDDLTIVCKVPLKYDIYFQVVATICFSLYVFEFIVNSWTKSSFVFTHKSIEIKGFFFSFFWFLDLITIFSLIPDVFDFNPFHISTTTQRIIRLVRLLRLVNSYKVSLQLVSRQVREENILALAQLGISYDFNTLF